ncbi:MAG: hypothetical protein ABSF29_14930 [Tepidisphaeraceae bacterium]|jgi:hypothetical protein
MSPTISRSIVSLIFVSCAVCGGCASENQGRLDLISFDRQHEFGQTFSQAYIARNDMGDMDIMLVTDGVDVAGNADPSKPLSPDAVDVPRQYVHIRVFWKPLTHRADHPAATNASVQWCLIGNGVNEGSILQYDGSGLVILDDSGGVTNVDIRSAWMKALAQRGTMVDPLGPCDLNGKVVAINDPDRVTALLAEMKSAAGITQAQAPAEVGAQPQRLSINP